MNSYKELTNNLKKEADPAFVRRAKIIFKELGLKKGDRVLDVGCGRGFYVNSISCLEGVEVVGVDLNKEYLNQAKKLIKKNNVQLEVADVTKLPFEDNSFDKVIASEILEHLGDDNLALKEIYRVMKPGAIIIATVPNQNYPFFWDPINWTLEKFLNKHIPSNIWWLAGIWADHDHLYTEDGLKKTFVESGFIIDSLYKTTKYSLPFSHFLLYGIGKNLVEKGVLKSFNRFDSQEPGALNNFLLWPIRAIDRLNENRTNFNTSVNLIVKARK